MRDLRGRNALVTGASRGLGAIIARELAAARVNLVITSRVGSAEELGRVATALRELGVHAIPISADVTVPVDRRCLIEQAQAELGSIDLLINNAGLEHIAHFESMDEDIVRTIIETNLVAPVELARLSLPGMLARRCGYIVNISSMAGTMYLPYNSVYSAAKAGLNSWTLALRDELQGTGVSVSAICPGFIRKVGMAARERSERGIKLKKRPPTVPPEKIAKAMLDAIRRDLPLVLVWPTPI